MKSLFLLLLISGQMLCQNAQSYLMSGNVKLIALDYTNAVNDFTKAIEMDPVNPQPYFNRGMAKAGLKDYKSALADYNKAVELDPKRQDVYYKRGLVKFELEMYKEAISDYDKAIILNPKDVIDRYNNTETYINRGIANYNLQNINAAISDFSHALAIDPKNGLAYCYRGLCKFNINLLDEGCVDLKKAAALNFSQATDLIKEFCN